MSKFQVGDVWVNGEGRKVRILATDIKASMPVLGAITGPYGNETVESYTDDGYYHGSKISDSYDLVSKYVPPVIPIGYVNLYRCSDGIRMIAARSVHDTADEASKAAQPDVVSIAVPIYEVGMAPIPEEQP